MSDPSLGDVQRWMKSFIQPLKKSSAPSTDSFLNPQHGTPGVERLSIYAGGYYARFEESLKETYEAIRTILGDETFHTLCVEYAEQFPSTDYNLSLAGKHFEEFLVSHTISTSFPFLSDLARLERFVSEAFHAHDETPITSSAFANLSTEDWDQTQLLFQHSLRLLSSRWPILTLWKERKAANLETPIAPQTQNVMIMRIGLQVRLEELDMVQYGLLSHLKEGQVLGKACESLAQDAEGVFPPVSEWFSKWVSFGLMIGFQRQQNKEIII